MTGKVLIDCLKIGVIVRRKSALRLAGMLFVQLCPVNVICHSQADNGNMARQICLCQIYMMPFCSTKFITGMSCQAQHYKSSDTIFHKGNSLTNTIMQLDLYRISTLLLIVAYYHWPSDRLMPMIATNYYCLSDPLLSMVA